MPPRGKLKSIGAPGFDGMREPVPSSVEITVPSGEKGWKKVQHEVVTNIRECPLAYMRSRDWIDDAQLKAGEWFQRQYNNTMLSSGAVDPSYEPVDISGHADPIPDRVLTASQAIAKAKAHLQAQIGVKGWLVIELVCGQGFSIARAAQRRWGFATRGQIEFTGHTLREALDVLAAYLGYATVDKPNTRY